MPASSRVATIVSTVRAAHQASIALRRESPAPMLYGMYIAHNYQFLSYAAMMEGRSDEACRAARDMVAVGSEDLLKAMPEFDGILAMPIIMDAKFGRWDKVLAARPMPEGMAFPEAMRHYARGLAQAAKKDSGEASKELAAVDAALAATPEDAKKFLNPSRLLLGIARDVLAGEVALSTGNTDEGLRLLAKAVAAEDTVGYDEPPDWYYPASSNLGDFLLAAKRPADAETVFSAELVRYPENGWALAGLADAQRAQKKSAQATATAARLAKAWAQADVKPAAR